METNSSTLLVIVASTRPGGLGPAIGRWFTEAVADRAAEHEVSLRTLDLRSLALPWLDEPGMPADGHYVHAHTKRWSETVQSADGCVFVVPEHNSGMPGSLKNAMDALHAEWVWKPAGIVSYGMTSAGTRALLAVRQTAAALQMVPTPSSVSIRVREEIRDGALVPSAPRDERASDMLDEAVRLARLLAPMREAQLAVADGPLPGSFIRLLGPQDAGDIVLLQRASWVDEALVNERLDIEALREGETDVVRSLAAWSWWGLRRDGRLLGMVRARVHEGAWELGRLAVEPSLRGRGVGGWLARFAESQAPEGVSGFQLTTGLGSGRNLALYERMGYRRGSVDVPRGTVQLSRAAAAVQGSR